MREKRTFIKINGIPEMYDGNFTIPPHYRKIWEGLILPTMTAKEKQKINFVLEYMFSKTYVVDIEKGLEILKRKHGKKHIQNFWSGMRLIISILSFDKEFAEIVQKS